MTGASAPGKAPPAAIGSFRNLSHAPMLRMYDGDESSRMNSLSASSLSRAIKSNNLSSPGLSAGDVKIENFRRAGIADRATIRTGDMRDMPLDDHSFDLVMSSAAIDHLPEDDIRKTLSEVRRVLVPGGQFFLAVSVPNLWMAITFGPLVLPRLRKRAFWRGAFADAGLSLEGEGTLGASAWFLARSEPVGT